MVLSIINILNLTKGVNALYILNLKTGTLHIENMCHHMKPYDYKKFKTEQQANEYAGKHLRMCKLCERNKEKALKEKTQ